MLHWLGERWRLYIYIYIYIYIIIILLNSEAAVSELIDIDTRWWKIHLLENLYSEEDAKIILSLPISFTNREDVCIWRGSTSGEFFVCSAYYIQNELENRTAAESSSSKGQKTVWRNIWGLRVPNVEKKFLWRACHEILPTRKNLQRRKIIEDPLCPICGLEEETVLHILWECSLARNVWGISDVKFQKCSSLGMRFLEVVEEIF
jgi:hypothetical protein